MLPRLSLPPSPATLALIALAFALPGLAGHDLWKTHDAIGLGIVHDMTTSGAPLIVMSCTMPRPMASCVFHRSWPARPGSANASAMSASVAGDGGRLRRGSIPLP